MSKRQTCPVCGAVCRVVGDTTLHYEPVGSEEMAALREENRRLLVLHAWLTKAISTEQAQAYFEAKPDDGALWRFSLQARKRGRALVEEEKREHE